jgi:enoyl-CoA hydratase/carnithine racemase
MSGTGAKSVATIALAPGPLADVTSGAGAELVASLTALAADPPRALLVDAGAGVGADEPRPATPRGLTDPAAQLAAFPGPTIAWWDGPAIGAGVELLLAADVRVIGEQATMTLPEVTHGELPCWGGTQRLPRVAGVAVALRMLVVGETVDAATLERAGVAICAPDPGAAARELADQLAAGAPHAQSAAREAVLRGIDLTLADGHRLESDLNLLLSTTRDRAEGIAAFFEKRPPRFEGE